MKRVWRSKEFLMNQSKYRTSKREVDQNSVYYYNLMLINNIKMKSE